MEVNAKILLSNFASKITELFWPNSINVVYFVFRQNVVERARNRMRIRIANYMMAATALACLAMVYFGKQAAQRGESVAQQNIEWHRKINEEAKKEKV